jgi:hypothetical protein
MTESVPIAKELGVASESVSGVPSNLFIVPVNLRPNTSVCKPLAAIPAIAGICARVRGPVKLERIQIKWDPQDSEQSIAFVAGSSNMEISSMSEVKEYPGGYKITTGDAADKEMRDYELSLPAGMAMQINPASGFYPTPAIYVGLKGSKGECTVFFHLRVYGTYVLKATNF